MKQAQSNPKYIQVTEEVIKTFTKKELRWFACSRCEKEFSVLEEIRLNLVAECPVCGSFVTMERR